MPNIDYCCYYHYCYHCYYYYDDDDDYYCYYCYYCYYYNYRRDLTVWAFRPNASAPNGFTQAGAARVWGGPAAYSGLTKQGDFVIFEGGPAYRYQSVMVARVPVF